MRPPGQQGAFMRWLKIVAMAILFGGTAVSASAAVEVGDASQQLQSVSSWVAQFPVQNDNSTVDANTVNWWIAYLNSNYRDLNLKATVNIESPQQRSAISADLDALEAVLRGERPTPAKQLVHISCAHIVCGDGHR